MLTKVVRSRREGEGVVASPGSAIVVGLVVLMVSPAAFDHAQAEPPESPLLAATAMGELILAGSIEE